MTLTVTLLLYLGVPIICESETVIVHAQYQGPEIEAAKWNSSIINFIIYQEKKKAH